MNYLHNDWLYMFIVTYWPHVTGLMFILAMIYIYRSKELE